MTDLFPHHISGPEQRGLPSVVLVQAAREVPVPLQERWRQRVRYMVRSHGYALGFAEREAFAHLNLGFYCRESIAAWRKGEK